MMILILTYAKVCTTSISHLLNERFPGEVYTSHGLSTWLREPLARVFAANDQAMPGLRPFFDGGPAILDRLAEAMAAGEQVTVISGVRDPIARSLSVAMQNFDDSFLDCVGPTAEATANVMAARIADLWLNDTESEDPVRAWLELMVRAPFRWFKEEIETPFGLDLKARPFDQDRGYTILSKDNVRLLLFRQEKAPTAIEQGLAELFPDIDVTLPHINDGADKSTADIYCALQACFRLPRSALVQIYAHPEINPYFGESDIAAAIDRWAEPLPTRTWVLPPPPAAPRPTFAATLFIPLRNHAEWIGAQLDSLFAQWRPDLEMVLVDDGSTDGSFAVASQRLATRPDVAATVMRNSKPIGHGMLPHLVKFSKAPIIIQADSDDITLPGRIDTIIDHFNANPDCKVITSNAVLINESGLPTYLLNTDLPDVIIDDPVKVIDQQGSPFWLGASSAYHRSIIEAFEPLDPELCAYGLDLLTGFRAVLLGSHHYLSRPLVGWRQHARNSHRMIGALNNDPVALEHVGAVYVMIRAQRLRDVAWLRANGKIAPERAEAIEAKWRADYTSKADEWIRHRNRLTGTHATPQPRDSSRIDSDPHVPGIPPIFTLVKGYEYSINDLFHALAFRPGIHLGAPNTAWTSRQSMFSARIPDFGAKAIILTMAGLPYCDTQSVFISVDFVDLIEVKITAGHVKRVTVPIVRRFDPGGGIVTLMIVTPDATKHSSFTPNSNDDRILGVALFSLQVV